jgi:hypothetical protein
MVDEARRAVLDGLQSRGTQDATQLLGAVEQERDFDEISVKRALWQLLGEGKVELDADYRLSLAKEARNGKVHAD